MKFGVNFKIDVTKLNKERFFKGKKGTYVDLTAFIDTDNEDDYGQNGGIAEAQTKEERDGGEKSNFVGNVKVFWKDGGGGGGRQESQPISEEDVPF